MRDGNIHDQYENDQVTTLIGVYIGQVVHQLWWELGTPDRHKKQSCEHVVNEMQQLESKCIPDSDSVAHELSSHHEQK